MATVYEHPAYNAPTAHPSSGGCVALSRLWPAASGALGAADEDIIRFYKLKRGDVVYDCLLQAGDLDTSTGIVLEVEITDGTTTKTLIAGSTVGQAGGIIRPTKIGSTENGVGYVVPSNAFRIQVRASTVATGSQAADVRLGVILGGHRDQGNLTE